MWEAAMQEANRQEVKSAMSSNTKTSGGSMHDGRKRRDISPPENLEDEEFEYVPGLPEDSDSLSSAHISRH